MTNEKMKESALNQVANARSIAFYGASNRPGTMGASILGSIISGGYEGKVFPVHPKETEIRGLKAYQHANELPEVPDLAILVLPTSVVCDTMKACGEKGIKRAIIVSGGFKEAGKKGIELEQQLMSIAKQYDIRVIGPNCLGIANPYLKLNTTPLVLEGNPGKIGLVSQSGSFVAQMYNYLNLIGQGFSTAFSVGNEMDLDLVDCVEYLAECPNTKVIVLYIEGVKRGRRFLEMAKQISKQKPIVALYVGGSEAGRKAAFSHTGSMSGPDQLYEGMMSQSGIIRASTVAELFDFSWALAELPEASGSNIVIQTHSGGPGACAADSCSRENLVLPSLSETTLENLKPLLPKTASNANPVDLTFTQEPIEYYKDIPEVLLNDSNLDFLLLYVMVPENTVLEQLQDAGFSEDQSIEAIENLTKSTAKALKKLRDKTEKPVVGFTFRSIQEKFNQGLIKNGIPVYQDPARAVRAIKAVSRYYSFKEKVS